MRTDPYRWMPIVMAVLVLGVLILAFQNHRLAGRVAALEQQGGDATSSSGERVAGGGGAQAPLEYIETVDADGSMLVASKGRRRDRGRGRLESGRVSSDGGEPAVAVDELMEDPEFQERLGDLFSEYSSTERTERRERRSEYMADRISETVAGFAAEHDLDAETEAQVSQILADYVAQRLELRDAMMDGDADTEQIRAEREQISERTDAALIELLGQELFDVLDSQMPGPGRH